MPAPSLSNVINLQRCIGDPALSRICMKFIELIKEAAQISQNELYRSPLLDDFAYPLSQLANTSCTDLGKSLLGETVDFGQQLQLTKLSDGKILFFDSLFDVELFTLTPEGNVERILESGQANCFEPDDYVEKTFALIGSYFDRESLIKART